MRRRGVIAGSLVLGLAGCGAWRVIALPPSAPPVQMDDVRSGFRETLALVAAGRYEEGRPRLEYLLARDPSLEDHYLYHLGVVQAQTGDAPTAVATLHRLRRDHPRSVWSAAAARELGRLSLSAGRLDDAEAYLTLARYATWDRSASDNARLDLARVLMARGDVAGADALLTELRRTGGRSVPVTEARALQESMRATHPDIAPRGAAWVDEARLLLDEGDYVAAEKAARTADPTGENADALLLLASALKGQGAPAAATTTLASFVRQFPSHPLAPQALFRMATLFWNRDEDVAAEAAFRQLLRRFPSHASAADALYAVGRIQQAAGRVAAARTTYADLARRYPMAAVAPEVRWRLGWIEYRNRRYGQAAAAFAALARVSHGANEAAAAHYWRARALQRAGRSADARALYRRVLTDAPTSYYAGRAEARLGIERAGTTADPPQPLVVPPPPPTIDSYHLGRSEALRAAGLLRLAWAELAALERDGTDDQVRSFLVHAYLDADAYPAARRVAREIAPAARLSGQLRQRLEYPLGFWPVVRAEAERYRVDPLLVAALIRQESQFDAEARSPADARGLMQLLPATAQHEARALGWNPDAGDRLDDPSVNIALGVRHFRAQLDRWDGDVVKALAAYNGGAAAVEKWERRYGDLESDEFVESITYRETREYVKRVLGNHRTYGRLYGNGRAAGVALPDAP